MCRVRRGWMHRKLGGNPKQIRSLCSKMATITGPGAIAMPAPRHWRNGLQHRRDRSNEGAIRRVACDEPGFASERRRELRVRYEPCRSTRSVHRDRRRPSPGSVRGLARCLRVLQGSGKRLCGAIGGGTNFQGSEVGAGSADRTSQWYQACSSGGTYTFRTAIRIMLDLVTELTIGVTIPPRKQWPLARSRTGDFNDRVRWRL